MDKTTKVAIGVVVLLLIASIAWFSQENEQQTLNNEPIKIGYIGPLSGGVAVLGTEAVSSMEIAVEQANAKGGVNGRTIKLITEDDQYDTAKAVTAYEKLVNVDGVETIIMSTYGGVMAVAEKAKKDNVLIIDPLDCDKGLADTGNNIFCIAKETKDLADVIADYATEAGYNKSEDARVN